MTNRPDAHQDGFAVLSGEAALFDMDGTLVDSAQVVEDVWTEFARRNRIDPAAILAVSHGRKSHDTIARFLPEADVDTEAQAILNEELNRLEGIKPIAGAADFFSAVAQLVPVAVVTSAPRELAIARLEAAGMPAPLVLVSGGDVIEGKPNPEGYIVAAHRLGAAIDRSLAFEDAEAGLTAALHAGALTIVVGSHESPRTATLFRLRDFSDAEVRGVTGLVEISVRSTASQG